MNEEWAGIKLYAALTETSSGADKMSLDKNFAVSIPPRFLLYSIH